MKYFFLFLTLIYFGTNHAQEINVEVTVNTPKLQTADPKVFKNLQNTMRELLNNQKWTSDEFEQKERIDLKMSLTISEEISSTRFKGELAISAVRPTYQSSYETPLMNHLDKDVVFDFHEFSPLQYSENAFTDNLVSVLAFYAYIVLGLDYDSYSPYGGEPYFQKALDIVSNVPPSATSTYPGWRSLENRNRYWMVENWLSPRVKPMRQAMYDYHRQGLDVAHTDVETARANMLEALTDIDKVNKAYPNSVVINAFINAKSNEIIEIFKEGSIQEKAKVYQIMIKLDAANASKYRAIRR